MSTCSPPEAKGSVPVLEAAACGVPSIVANFTAQPELVDGYGWCASVQPDWDAAQKSWFATPLIHSIVEQLEVAYDDARNSQRRQAARQFALGYDTIRVFDRHRRPILEEMDRRMPVIAWERLGNEPRRVPHPRRTAPR
jgi:glycosyltransferase involved in cell wall biosynthesis